MSKRLQKDIRDIKTQEAKNREKKEDTYIFIEMVNDNMHDLLALVIGPTDTPYEGGFFFFSVKPPPDYPFSPPKVKFLSPENSNERLHPNLYQAGSSDGGKVCLSILGTWSGEKWTSLLTLEKMLLTIQGLLDNNPITHEPAYENKTIGSPEAQQYCASARYLTLFMAHRQLLRDNHPFSVAMRKYFIKHQQIYHNSLAKLTPWFGKPISHLHYHAQIPTSITKHVGELMTTSSKWNVEMELGDPMEQLDIGDEKKMSEPVEEKQIKNSPEKKSVTQTEKKSTETPLDVAVKNFLGDQCSFIPSRGKNKDVRCLEQAKRGGMCLKHSRAQEAKSEKKETEKKMKK